MRNKIAGALYGMALGDSMGMPSELWGRKRVRNYFGKITGFLDGPSENEVAFNYKKGQFTDDTAQGLLLLDSLKANNFKVVSSDIANRFIHWAEENDAWELNILGPTSKVALANYKVGLSARQFTDKALSNGSAMRIAPIGCFYASTEKEKLASFVAKLSEVTHTSDISIAGASAIAVAVSSAIDGNDFDKILEDVYEIIPIALDMGAETFSASLVERIKIGIEIANECSGDDDKFINKVYDIVGAGVPLIESVPAAITIAYYAKDPNVACLLCANLAGDTDTIGAMATSICGAYVGLNNISSDYIKTLENENDINFTDYVDILLKGRDFLK